MRRSGAGAAILPAAADRRSVGCTDRSGHPAATGVAGEPPGPGARGYRGTRRSGIRAHAIAPASNTADTPVIAATGTPRVSGGPASLVYDDLVNLKDALDAAEVPVEGRRLVLSTAHWNDLLVDRKNFGDKLVNYNTGMPAPVIAGFELYQYNGNPLYTSAGVKKAFGAVKDAGDRQGSFAFWIGQIAKKTGMTKQYFKEAKNDPEAQTNLINYRHYFIAMPFDSKAIGAIY